MRNILFRTGLIVSLVLVVSVPAFAQMKIGDSPTSITTGAQLDIEKSGSRTVFMDTGKVGIGDTSPASLLTVGSGDLFQVDSTGNIVKINNVTTSFPSSQGSAGTILTNNGSGTLTWSAPAGISADSLNFTDLSDSLLLDASTDIFSSGTNVLSVTNSGTGLSLRVNDDGTLTDTTPFVVDASGNVGIGTAAPASKLEVNMGSAHGTVSILSGNASYYSSLSIGRAAGEVDIASVQATNYFSDNAVAGDAVIRNQTRDLILTARNASGSLLFKTGAADTTKAIVTSAGNFGVGDSTPASMLTVGSGDLFQVNSSGSIAAVAGITMTSGALSIPNGDLGSGSTLRFKNASNANDGAIYETNGNHLMIHSGAANSIVLRDSSSNYGAWFNFGGNGFTFYNNYDDAASRGALTFYRYRSSATAPAAGFGTFLDFNLEGYTNGTQVGTGRISSLWENTQTNDTTDRDAALTFSTTADNSSSERMRIASGGNVGIGNTNPTFKLDILSGTINTGTGGYGANPGALAVTAPDLAIGAAGGSMLFTSNSDFGIDKGGSIALGGRYATGSANDTIFAKVKGAKETAGTSNQGGYLAFATFNHNAGAIAERARIDSSGNLGIGTTSPAGKVQVVTTSDTTPDTVTVWDARHLTVGATGSTGGGVGISYDQTNNRGYISAATPNTAWRDIIIGAGTANVGIGMTTAPTAKLTVSGGDILLDNGKKVYMGSITNGAGYFFDGTGAWGMKAYNSGANYYTDLEFDSTGGSGSNSRGIRLMDWNGSAVRLFVGDTGNVGVGNTNPGYLLHVGSASVTDGTTVLRLEDANSTCSFTANTGAPTCGSDETLKKNITDLGGSLSKIDALRLVEYNWKTDAPGTAKQTGFIAQEVEKVFPKLVTEQKWIDGTSKKFLETAGLLPYIVGATQELSVQTKSNTAEITELKKENADMKAEISDLKTRLDRLEEKLK